MLSLRKNALEFECFSFAKLSTNTTNVMLGYRVTQQCHTQWCFYKSPYAMGRETMWGKTDRKMVIFSTNLGGANNALRFCQYCPCLCIVNDQYLISCLALVRSWASSAQGLMSFQSPTPGSVQQSIRVPDKPTWANAGQLESLIHTQLHTWNIPQAGGKGRTVCRMRHVAVKASWGGWELLSGCVGAQC